MSEPRHPLAWPSGWKRTASADRRRAQFSKTSRSYHDRALTTHDGIRRVMDAIRAFTRAGKTWVIDPETVIISTNMPTRLDGGIRADARRPDDPGAAVYWTKQRGERQCMAIDQYDTVGDNLAAIAATLDAMRAIERHGGATILDRAFTGFTALPAPIVAGMARPWREVLGFLPGPVTAGDARARYRVLAMDAHPDRGGTAARMAELNRARDEAIEELS